MPVWEACQTSATGRAVAATQEGPSRSASANSGLMWLTYGFIQGWYGNHRDKLCQHVGRTGVSVIPAQSDPVARPLPSSSPVQDSQGSGRSGSWGPGSGRWPVSTKHPDEIRFRRPIRRQQRAPVSRSTVQDLAGRGPGGSRSSEQVSGTMIGRTVRRLANVEARVASASTSIRNRAWTGRRPVLDYRPFRAERVLVPHHDAAWPRCQAGELLLRPRRSARPPRQ